MDDTIALLQENLNTQERSKLELIARVYPELATPEKPECFKILAHAHLIELPAKTLLVNENETCDNFIMLLEGDIRIYQLAEDAREATLYYIAPGDICIMSVQSIINNRPFKANAESDSDIKAIMLSSADFNRAMEVSDKFRNMVLSSLTNSFSELMSTVYSISFQKLEIRLSYLLGCLFERAESDVLKITHQELSQQLGTTREVVSRILKQMEQQECISLSRGQISIGSRKGFPQSKNQVIN